MTSESRGRGQERRRHRRANFTWKAAVGPDDTLDLVPATTTDVSVGGVRLHGHLTASPGDDVLVIMSLKNRTVPARATVIKSEIVDEDTVELRLEFTEVSDLTKENLAKLTREAPASDPPAPEGP